jgi:hypothetical protein
LTDSGHTDCDSFIHAAQVGNPLIVVAPSIIAGSGVTVHILSMIGANAAATVVQAETDRVGQVVSKLASTSINEVKNNPLILVAGAPALAVQNPTVAKVVNKIPAPPMPGPPIVKRGLSCIFTPWHGCVH